jgi:hypothetical protein
VINYRAQNLSEEGGDKSPLKVAGISVMTVFMMQLDETRAADEKAERMKY